MNTKSLINDRISGTSTHAASARWVEYGVATVANVLNKFFIASNVYSWGHFGIDNFF